MAGVFNQEKGQYSEEQIDYQKLTEYYMVRLLRNNGLDYNY